MDRGAGFLVSRPRILLLGHYPLENRDRAPVVRTWAMAEALARYAAVTAISGTRSQRAVWIRAFLAAGRLGQVDGVYLEAGTSTMTRDDHALLAAIHRRGLPLGIYIRDAYQRFPDLYPPKSPKEWAMARAYALTTWRYRRLAAVLFFPTDGLADLFPHPNRQLLPPAGTPAVPPGARRHPHRVVYVGANGPYDGVDVAVAAMTAVARQHPDAELVLVTRPQETPRNLPPVCRAVTAAGDALHPWLWSSSLALVPRRDTAYTRLALPIKLFDYLSHGLPVIATGPSETSKLVVSAGVGIPVPPDPGRLAEAILSLWARPERLAAMGAAALNLVAQQHNWDARAQQVLGALGFV